VTTNELDTRIRLLAQQLNEANMRLLGINDTMRLANAYNRVKFGRQDTWRRQLYETALGDLLEENGPCTRPPLRMHDGWAIDTSMSLPHLDRVLEDSDKIIAERSGVRQSASGAYRSYFQDVWTAADAATYPSFIDFATSSDVLAVVSDYLKCIPAFTTIFPSGIRFVESNAAYDDQPNTPHDSQLYHIDYYCLPNVYVLVLLRDTTFEHGPWTFLPRAASQKARTALRYWERGRPYRLSDEEVYSVAPRDEVIEFSYPRGTVLFIESSGCFHYGSRNSVKPRFQLMYGYSGACRTDFGEVTMKLREFPVRERDSRLRKLVLTKYTPAPGQASDMDESELQGFVEVWNSVTGQAVRCLDELPSSIPM